MIIINSDDFGYSKSVNKAIYDSFQQNLISSTTALVTFKEGLEDAIEYVKLGKMQMNSIGIHFNLTEGEPVTDSIKNNSLFCSNNLFNGNARQSSIFYLNKQGKEMVYKELKGQMLRFIEAFGEKPTHCDSHHHVHTEWAIGEIVQRVAKEFGIEKIRISRNVGDESNTIKKIYRRLYNLRNRLKGYKGVHYFGDIVNMKNINFEESNNYEIMVHSIYGEKEAKEVLDLDYLNLDNKLKELFKKDTWKLNSYADI